MHAAAASGDLRVAQAQQRIVAAHVHAEPVGVALSDVGQVLLPPGAAVEEEAARLPHLKPLFQLLRKGLGITGQIEGLLGEDGAGLMMAVARAAVRREAGDDHIGPERADHAHHIAQHLLLAPFLEALGGVLAVAEVHRAREELLAAIDPPRLHQLLRADDAERIAQLGADQVLSAVATREAEVAGAHLFAVGQPGDQLGVLVIGVGHDVEHAAQHVELLHAVQDLGGVGLGWGALGE